MQRHKILWAFCALAALFAMPVFGQTFGEITGRVSDASGAGVPGTAITLTNVNTNAVRKTESTGAGDYTFTSVPPGMYSVKAEHAGFMAATSNSVEVQVEQSVRLDIALQVGQVSQTVEVSAQAGLLQAENASVGTVVENTAVVELPLNGREYLNLVALSANVDTLSPSNSYATGREGGDRASQSISAAGQRISFDYFTLDGVTNTDPDFNSYIVLPSIDAIQEFKVQTGIYPAEFGHEATQINVLTKSGGNAYHGALFEFVRNDVLDAIPYAFTSVHPAKSPFKWNDYGFELDGPVRIPKLFNGRNRLFFMANYETLIQRQHNLATYSVPTAAMFTGNESALSTIIYDPLTGINGATKTPFPGNIIPASELDPISQRFLAYYASSILPGLTNNYVQVNSSPLNRDTFTVRMDWVESAKSQWSGRYSWCDGSQSTHGLSITGTKILNNCDQYLGTNTRTFTPTLVNEARFGYSKLYNTIGTLSAFVTDSVTGLGIPNLPAGPPVQWGVPPVGFSGDGFSGIGDSSDTPYQINDNILQFVDNVSWIHGKHSFRFGFEYNRQNFDQTGNQFARGDFIYQPQATQSSSKTGGDAFAEFLLGYMYESETAVALASANMQRNTEAAFVDDTWKVTPKLTLSLGLRYELTPPWYDLDGNLLNVNMPQIDAFSNAPVSEEPFYVRQGNCTNPYAGLNFFFTVTPFVCSNGLLPNQLVRTAYNNWAPRVAIAYSPDSRTVVRVGYGIFYDQDIGNALFDIVRNTGAKIQLNETNGIGMTWAQAVLPGTGGTGTGIVNIPAPVGFMDAPEGTMPYSLQYLFNVQRQFAGNWLVEAGYLGSESHHLQDLMNSNQGIPGTVGSATSRRPWQDFSTIQEIANGSNAVYNSLSVKVTRRFTRGFSLVSSWTWSRSIDDGSDIRPQGGDNGSGIPQNSYCVDPCERGLSAFNVKNRFVVSPLYDLPVGKGQTLNINNRFLNALLGGWQSGGIFTLQSGTPGTLNIGGVDNASTTGGDDRPDATGLSPYLSNPTPSRYYSLAAYYEAPPGQFGNVGRESIVAPGIFNIDFELHKQFRMPYKDNHILQFRFEAFNALNHPNWGMPNLNILAGAAQAGLPGTDSHTGFGQITSTTTSMRQMQLGLKYVF
jgi:Carboxypeptidase regulatory-like domain